MKPVFCHWEITQCSDKKNFISAMPQFKSSMKFVSIEYTILVLAVPKRPELGDAVPSSGLRGKHLTHEPYDNSNNVFELNQLIFVLIEQFEIDFPQIHQLK